MINFECGPDLWPECIVCAHLQSNLLENILATIQVWHYRGIARHLTLCSGWLVGCC